MPRNQEPDHGSDKQSPGREIGPAGRALFDLSIGRGHDVRHGNDDDDDQTHVVTQRAAELPSRTREDEEIELSEDDILEELDDDTDDLKQMQGPDA